MEVKRVIMTQIQLIILLFFVALNSFAVEEGVFKTEPHTNADDKPWRIGYYQGGELNTYPKVLLAMVEGLVELGWLEEGELPPPGSKLETVEQIWYHLASLDNRYLHFVNDGFWSSEWDDEIRGQNIEKMFKRFNTQRDIDLMIAMGTWAGVDLSTDAHQTNVVVFDAANAVKSGIIDSIQDSGRDYVHARVDPLRNKRQIRLFYNLINFEKLGIAYENSETGEVYAGIDDVRDVAKELGFKVVRCFTTSEVPDNLLHLAEESVRKCYQDFLTSVDAVYITYQKGIENLALLEDGIKMLTERGIYTFSKIGSEHVKIGALMSIALVNYKGVGRFHAKTIAQILNGAKPRQLEQIYPDSMNIAINLDTAKKVGFEPPISLLGATDELYSEALQKRQKEEHEFFD